jgi:quinol monooxygenase YgiN
MALLDEQPPGHEAEPGGRARYEDARHAILPSLKTPARGEIALPKSAVAPYSGAMLLIAGSVRFPVESMPKAREAMARMISATRAEDGCQQYAFAEDVLDPGLIHISEVWRDHAALERHAASAHMTVWRAAGRELEITDRNIRLYEVGDGRRV